MSAYAASLAHDTDDDDMPYDDPEGTNMLDEDEIDEMLEEIDEEEDDEDYEDQTDDEDQEIDFEDAQEELQEHVMDLLLESGQASLDENGEIVVDVVEASDSEIDGEDEDDEEDMEGTDDATTQTAAAPSANAAPPAPPGIPAVPPTPAIHRIPVQQFLQQLLRTGQLRQFGLEGLFGNADDDDDDEDNPAYQRLRSRRQREFKPHPPLVREPVPEGVELMESGKFGVSERTMAGKKKVASRILQRELGLGSPGKERGHNKLVSHELLPSSNADMIINYEDRCYSGQFSEDGNFYFTCSQDFRVRMYDTSNPYKWRHYKTVLYPYGNWTLTDATLSPDNKYLAYSSMKHIVCLANTEQDTEDEPHTLNLADRTGRQQGRGARTNGRGDFGIFSLRFSGDGSEIVVGTNRHEVLVYDLEARRTIVQIEGHDDEVNAVCYGDKSSPHILYSGSDDSTIKVWDRRSLGDGRPAGCFIGHTEGVTYVDSKGDGRYVLSNGKDQRMKLWDLRKMAPTEKADGGHRNPYREPSFDYRSDRFEDYGYRGPHPDDCSVVTFRGHAVLNTLIRCHFSPPGSTDSRYVYSGSADGSVYIYNLDSTLAKKIDVLATTRNTRPKPSPEELQASYWGMRRGNAWDTCVRDVSWHPNAPVIAATAWNGYGQMWGTCTAHTWNDGLDEDDADPPMGLRVDAKLNRMARAYGEEVPNPRRVREEGRFRRAAFDDDDA